MDCRSPQKAPGQIMNQLYEKLMIRKTAGGPGSVRIIWLGTAGMFVTDGKTGILIDPYVSRFGMGRVAFRLPLEPNRPLIQKWAGRFGRDNIAAVIASHSHFDHAADAPYFAIEAHAPLVGTSSTLNIGRGAGMEENKLVEMTSGRTLCFGNFTIKFIESAHGPAVLGRIPYPGTIDKPLIPPGRAADYRLGGVFALLIQHPAGAILHHGSAGFKPQMYDGTHADVILLGIAGRGNTDQYLENVVLKTRARLVLPIHMDNFFKPLENGMSLLPTVRFGEFCRKTENHRLSFTMNTLPFCNEVGILPLDEIPKTQRMLQSKNQI